MVGCTGKSRKCLTLAFHLVSSAAVSSAWIFPNEPTPSKLPVKELSRRKVMFQWAAASLAASAGTPLPSLAAVDFTPKSDPMDYNAPREEGLMSPDKVATILNVVPTFTIVDKKGVPFMVVGEDAKVTGYFFTTFEEADRVLQLAKTSADKAIQQAKKEGEDFDENPWTKARISTVPLDSAVTLVTKSVNLRNNYFQMAPAVDDVEDALALSGKKDLPEGKVPLFYMQDFTIPDPNDKSQKQSPLYFHKAQLEEDYKRQHPGQELPEIQVSELFAVLLEMVKPGGTDEEIKTLVIVPPKESAQKAKQCMKGLALGERNLVL